MYFERYVLPHFHEYVLKKWTSIFILCEIGFVFCCLKNAHGWALKLYEFLMRTQLFGDEVAVNQAFKRQRWQSIFMSVFPIIESTNSNKRTENTLNEKRRRFASIQIVKPSSRLYEKLVQCLSRMRLASTFLAHDTKRWMPWIKSVKEEGHERLFFCSSSRRSQRHTDEELLNFSVSRNLPYFKVVFVCKMGFLPL